jgi:hypothetical protein
MSKNKKPIDHIRDEFLKTIDDLSKTYPGLQASLLVSLPYGNDVAVQFASTHAPAQAITLMNGVMKSYAKHSPIPTDEVAEAV